MSRATGAMRSSDLPIAPRVTRASGALRTMETLELRDASYTVGHAAAALDHVLALPHTAATTTEGGTDLSSPGLSSFSLIPEEPYRIQTVDGRVLERTPQGWQYLDQQPRFGAAGTVYNGYQFTQSVGTSDFAPGTHFLPTQEEMDRKFHLAEHSSVSANPPADDPCGSSLGM
jgi:hypothetical protein